MKQISVDFMTPERSWISLDITFSDEQIRDILVAQSLVVGAAESMPSRYLRDVLPEIDVATSHVSINGWMDLRSNIVREAIVTFDMFTFTIAVPVASGGHMRATLAYDALS